PAVHASWPDEVNAQRFMTLVLPQGLFIGTLAALTVWGLWRRRAWGFLGAAFFLILAPTSSIMPIADLAFDHRMYLPLATLTTLAVLAGDALRRRLPSPGREAAAGAVVLTLAAVLGVLTVLRNTEY